MKNQNLFAALRAAFPSNLQAVAVETDVAALLEKVSDMDDLVVQFDGTDAGRRFVEAWKRARIIVDTGGGHSNGGATPTPPTPPTA